MLDIYPFISMHYHPMILVKRTKSGLLLVILQTTMVTFS